MQVVKPSSTEASAAAAAAAVAAVPLDVNAAASSSEASIAASCLDQHPHLASAQAPAAHARLVAERRAQANKGCALARRRTEAEKPQHSSLSCAAFTGMRTWFVRYIELLCIQNRATGAKTCSHYASEHLHVTHAQTHAHAHLQAYISPSVTHLQA